VRLVAFCATAQEARGTVGKAKDYARQTLKSASFLLNYSLYNQQNA
jgi:hypothetical protein